MFWGSGKAVPRELGHLEWSHLEAACSLNESVIGKPVSVQLLIAGWDTL